MSKILLYVDRGVDREGANRMIASLGSRVPIDVIDARTLIKTPWEKTASLLVVPGGRDVFYHALLDGSGTEKIRHYVQDGGNYLGICAGAYFACERIEFEKGSALEVCGNRSLKFFPGTAVGPAYGHNKYSYQNLKGAEAARISCKAGDCHVYFNGGCTFVPKRKSAFFETISHYLDLEGNPPAIVQMKVGKGSAILSGVHFEFSYDSLDKKNPHLSSIFPLLAKSETMRQALFWEILDKCLSIF